MYIYIYISQKITNLFSSQRIIFQLELPPRWYWKAREKEEFLPKNYFSWIFSERARTSHCRDNRREKIQGSFGSWWDNAQCDVTQAVYSPFFHPIFIALNNNFNRAIFLADSSLSLCRDYYITSDKRSSSQSDDVLAKSNNNNNNDNDAIHEATRRFPWLSNEIAIYKSLTIKLRNVQMKK